MPIVLTSNGLSSPNIISTFKKFIEKGLRKVSIIVTADPIYKEKNYHVMPTMEIFQKLGFEVHLLDLEFDSPNLLNHYDIVYFIGGNPFYLLHFLKIKNVNPILQELLNKGKVISGASAGSLVLGTTIAIISEFNPEMNSVNLKDFNALSLTKVNICPHYSKFILRYQNFEERIKKIEKENKIKIVRLDDGKAIIDDFGKITLI